MMESSSNASRGALAGCAVIQQKVTELVDLQELMRGPGAVFLDLYQTPADVQEAVGA
jgi:hypothetical protein